MKKWLSPTQRGFTLIEALIASLVGAVAILGLAKLQGFTLSNSADSRMKTHAVNFAQDKIEELRWFANENAYTGYSGSDNDTPPGVNSNFTRTWTITPCAHSVNCKQADVTVTWADASNAIQAVQLTSYIAGTDPVKSGVMLLRTATP